MSREIITRRNLPHWYIPGAMFFVTYRLAGSLPAVAMERLRNKRLQLLQQEPAPGESRFEQFRRAHKQWFAEYDDLLDQPTDDPWLTDARVAAKVRSNLYHHHGGKYHLLAFCMMPNHVHMVLQPIEVGGVRGSRADQSLVAKLARGPRAPQDVDDIGEREDGRSPLSNIMHSLKSYTAHEANKLLKRTGSFWQRESYDHWIRDDEELERLVLYIQANPVKAGLVKRPEDWFWCSCHDRYLADGEVTSWLLWEK